MAKRNAFVERAVIDCLIGHFVGDICAGTGKGQEWRSNIICQHDHFTVKSVRWRFYKQFHYELVDKLGCKLINSSLSLEQW